MESFLTRKLLFLATHIKMKSLVSNYVLCTGGLGYIGSHTVVQLLEAGYKVAILDNCSNSNPLVLKRIKKICGEDVPFYKVDLLDKAAVDGLFEHEKFDKVIHFAGLKAVGESCSMPLVYYQNNLTGTLNLLQVMTKHNCKKIVFSSSATVYRPAEEPLDESKPLGPSNPYGQTKLMIENFLQDLFRSDPDWHISILRYFNPVGAHPSGLIGENPLGPPNNLMPFIQQVAVGRQEKLTVFGNDWPTDDGTGVRDYLHVDDLSAGHLAALAYLDKVTDGIPNRGCFIHNLGTEKGFSVLEMKDAFEKNSGVKLNWVFGPRRPGDLASVVANANKANEELGWRATRDLDDIMKSAWNWQSQNPYGYQLK